MQVRHDLTCTLCQHSSHVVEEYMHLSLELPTAGQPQSIVPPDVKALLASYFQVQAQLRTAGVAGVGE